MTDGERLLRAVEMLEATFRQSAQLRSGQPAPDRDHRVRPGQLQQELSQPNVRPTSDGLSGAPVTYGDVPRLGPPLPGDLGKPILERQQQLATAVNPNDQQLEQAEAAERERRLAELKTARESGVLVQNRQTQPTGEASIAAPAATPANEPGKVGLDPTSDPNAQGRKTAFVAALDPKGDVNAPPTAERQSRRALP